MSQTGRTLDLYFALAKTVYAFFLIRHLKSARVSKIKIILGAATLIILGPIIKRLVKPSSRICSDSRNKKREEERKSYLLNLIHIFGGPHKRSTKTSRLGVARPVVVGGIRVIYTRRFDYRDIPLRLRRKKESHLMHHPTSRLKISR